LILSGLAFSVHFLALKNKNAAESLPQPESECLPRKYYTTGLANRQENLRLWN
jgi:hypothetical protein